MKQILDGLKILENLQIYHQDLKPKNIMIGFNDYEAVIGDFGHSLEYNSSDWIEEGNTGTPDYDAPEMEEYQPYLPSKLDIFALGVTMFEVVFGFLPFMQKDRCDDRLFKLL